MSSQVADEVRLQVENVGGIDEAELTLRPGVTLLEGRNATNRTSFLRALMAACGSTDVTVKGDAEEASVELALEDDTYEQTLQRRNGTVRAVGEPYIDDSTLADLFAFLLESNEARRAVVRSDDLRELIMRAIDTDEIERGIERAVEHRRELDAELEELDALKRDLPDLEAKRSRLRDEIEEKEAELKEKEAEIKSLDSGLVNSRERKSELEGKLEELGEERATLEDVRYDLETERERLNALESERRELEREREDLQEPPGDDIDDLESEISRLRERKQRVQAEINELQTVIGFNEEMLETGDHEVFTAVYEDANSAVTDELLSESEITCWTCGSDVERKQIETTIQRLRKFSGEKFDETSELDNRIEELVNERETLRETRRRREQVECRLDELETEIGNRDDTIDHLETRRDELRSRVREIEAQVDELEHDSHEEILGLHREANQLEYEIGRLEPDLDRVEENIATIESELDRRSELESEREELTEQIADLRTKIERTEQQAIEAFNEHMATLLDLLDYRNLDRIWLERTETKVRDGREKISKGVFELHVVRKTDSGTTYEDTIDHLSESEREVTGLVLALAGYLVHDVHEIVPFMLLDSLEAIDSERIAKLIDYFSEYSQYLVVALLPEDAAALENGYHRVTEI